MNFSCFLLSLVALECVALHHLPLSFAFYAPRFLILIFSYDANMLFDLYMWLIIC